MSWGATVEKLKFKVYVHPDCHTNCGDRLLEVTKAGCGTKHGQSKVQQLLAAQQIGMNNHQISRILS